MKKKLEIHEKDVVINIRFEVIQRFFIGII